MDNCDNLYESKTEPSTSMWANHLCLAPEELTEPFLLLLPSWTVGKDGNGSRVDLWEKALFYTMAFSVELIYPLVNYHSYGKSHFFMGKSTINGHVQ